LSEFLAEESASPEIALSRVVDDFRSISASLGVERQAQMYRRSLA
jgi:hypothetical protein